MKKSIKKNQIIIAALTVLLGVAGYINFSGNSLDLANSDKDDDKTQSAFAETDVDEAVGEITTYDMEAEENIELNSEQDEIGEAVLTSADTATNSLINSKLNREQVRSKAKEYYLDIINNDGMDEAAVASATDAYVKLTEDMEKESEAEILLDVNGYKNAIVSISNDNVDVIVCAESLTDTDRARIEDTVVRKTGCSVDQIIITTVSQ
ncbi:MAG: SpoIIIAH-like family protein [Clostridium sp.]|nr:SpoIIIAH-like family protein [Clostridium sp.]MCM1170507.1 SpoIIIAH-like family protein [Clostridium sp.]MCM1208072.1 SpoIIIAH-like family protein [Ruminococcus sp.]